MPPFHARLPGLGDLGKALVLAAARKRSYHPLVAVFPSKAQARAALDNLRFFLGADGADRVHYLPPADFDYYKGVLPSAEAFAERNVSLYHALNDAASRLFVTTLPAILQRVPPPGGFVDAVVTLPANAEVDRDDLALRLVAAGYQRQPVAYDPGVFSVRGNVVDIYSPLYRNPFRIELFGDLIEQVRFFDPRSQRSLESVPAAHCPPVGPTLLPHGEAFERAAAAVKARLDSLGIPKPRRDALLDELAQGRLPAAAWLLFPMLSGGSAALTDYLPDDTVFFWDGRAPLLEAAKEDELPRLRGHHSLYEKEPAAIASFDSLFLSLEELESLAARERSYFFEAFSSMPSGEGKIDYLPVSLAAERDAAKRRSSGSALEGFAKRMRSWMDDGEAVHVVCHTHTHEDRVRLLLEPYGIRVQTHKDGEPGFPGVIGADWRFLHVWQGTVTESASFPLFRSVVLSEEEIFGQKKRTSRAASGSAAGDTARLLAAFRDLKEGDYVVHKDHGIGRYLGLKSMSFLGVPNDYVLVEYRDSDKLYVPVYRLNVVQKYSGGEGASVAVDKLGGDRWTKAKSKARRAAQELAAEFMRVQARRKLSKAHAFAPPGPEYHQFEMEFPFDETPDQMRAIEEVMADLSRPQPMDRLIVGDVGYGKTEVAMRASFRVAFGGKQVCVVVPTTVLAFQHYESFRQRFKSTPVKIEMVSRMRPTAENKRVLQEVREGKVDIIIGTHRLFSNDVAFKDLGLVVVDEEHRFGVVHKERLKKLSENVHFLSMTATPIPRTLNMAMTGLKDISIISTPPPDRLSVRTFVCRRTSEVITEAISNELAREGQVFFVHNRIETIFKVAEDLKALLPKAKFEVAHGQMDGDDLERVMLGFYRGEFQVLLSTAIIESGLDIPRANTILIDLAEKLGLAQLYQLRGRVGRSDRRAYCYVLAPPEQAMTEDAKQRLQVIQRYGDLGSGFNVASYDLEIRGAGDLLGKEQSGHINAVGIDMYFELLEEAIAHERGERKRPEIEPEIHFKLAAYFPHDYLPDVGERITLYRRLSSVPSEEAVAEIEEEIRDRFGALPDEVQNLLGLMRIKLYLKRLQVTHMTVGPKRVSLLFAPTTPVSPERVKALLLAEPKRYSLTPDHKLVFDAGESDWRVLLKEVQRLGERLGA